MMQNNYVFHVYKSIVKTLYSEIVVVYNNYMYMYVQYGKK